MKDVPSLPLNLISTCPSLGFVNISWVAPLDTPLCVHSYTVTVRNSSQVIYNTTDNRSSLSITDLTSDGDYSVTVAGRDGAGRLGQESELNCNSILYYIIFHTHDLHVCSMIYTTCLCVVSAKTGKVQVKLNMSIDIVDVLLPEDHHGMLIHWNVCSLPIKTIILSHTMHALFLFIVQWE